MTSQAVEQIFGEEESGEPADFGCVAKWCEGEVFADKYIRNNVSRHLVGAGLGGELHKPLGNPNWAAKRLCTGTVDVFELVL